MRILYAEDNPANLLLVQRIARSGGHEIINYASGAEILKNFERDHPDLVLMDVQLEGAMTGLDVSLAEALARNEAGTAVNARALALLNAVRQRSDATTTFAPADKNALIALILNERRIELLGEGFRSLDVMRQVGTFGAKGSVGAVAPSVQSYVWPIPASELQLNSLMTPNN
jgi:CheY-like chemotaxis protein